MILERFVLGPLETNCYLVQCRKTKAAAIIDPAGEGEYLVKRITGAHLKLDWIINTHGHGDHIASNMEVKNAFPSARIAIHEADAACLQSAARNLSELYGLPVVSPPPDLLLKDGDEIAFGQVCLKVIHAAGHTAGGIALYSATGPDGVPVLFSGDALFAGSIGRTDLRGGSFDELISAIKTRLMTLPPETIVFPGHGPQTTIGIESSSNPFL